MFVGIDIGGTKCAVLKGVGKNIVFKKAFPTTDRESTLNKIFELVAMQGDFDAIGISCGGPLDEKTGVILCPPNLPDWINVPIVKMLEERFNKPAYLLNDANACALAEWRYGAGAGSQNMAFLTFGTGLGAGLVINGRLYSGTNGNAGEVGHIRLAKKGEIGFGKYGSFEGFCSGGGITRLAKIMAARCKKLPECIEKMKSTFASDSLTEVKALPEKYPQGAEKILIYNTTYRTVPEGKLPADIGVLVINVTTLALLAKYIKTGMPLVARTVTVDGSAVVSPKNVIVPLGTPIRELLDFCGVESLGKVLYGGPMMGIPAASTDEPTLKTTGGITALSRSDSLLKAPSACIHCGRCVEACPLYLEPDVFSRAFDYDNRDERMAILDKNKVMLCMECGCCSFVCPANRPLVQNNRIAKAQLRDYKMQIEKSKDKGEK